MRAIGSCYISKAAALLLCLSAGVQSGRAGEPYKLSFDKAKEAELWNVDGNINGLRLDKRKMNVAELYGGYKQGGFRRYSDALSEWNAGVRTEGMLHLEKLSMRGRFGFRQWQGMRMSGSMYIYPGFYPIDLLEFTPGTKNRQTYEVEGGLTYELSSAWSLGVNVDFTSDNIAKRKDLRHTNYRLDFGVAPAVMYRGDGYVLGLTYMFRKNSERVEAEQIVAGATNYEVFLDKGLGCGLLQDWRGAGVLLVGNGAKGLPVRENIHKVSLQAQYGGLYAELSYACGLGTVGERNVIWYNFPSHLFGGRVAYKGEKNAVMYLASIDAECRLLRNKEHTLDEYVEGGVTNYMRIATNTVYSETVFSVVPSYKLWSRYVDAGVSLRYDFANEVATQIYPCAGQRDVFTLDSQGYVEGHIWKFDLRVDVAVCKSFADEKKLVPEGASEPYRHAEYYAWEMEYIRSPKLNVGLSLRYNFWKGMYVSLGGSYLHGFELAKIAVPGRWALGLKYGIEF